MKTTRASESFKHALGSEYTASVGMEVHAELHTNSKMFCRCKVAFGGESNTRVCPVCIGLPGTLPVPNQAAIQMVLKTALALNCTIAYRSIFHRKNYFYPDLPKGYQISQYGETNPLGYKGYLDVNMPDGSTKRVRIRRVHLEEDTGKTMRLPGGGTGIDYNRAGVPLMEIVTDFPPDLSTPEECKEYISQLRMLLLYLGVCDGKMEQGSLRCEPNISVRRTESEQLGTKTELKNLGSFKAVQLGVESEVRRQIEVIEQGGVILQETRGWNEESATSYLMRLKEEENDYRYFPDPDLAPMEFSVQQIEELRQSLPELPNEKFLRYQSQMGLSAYDAGLLIADPSWANWFERCLALGGEPKPVCNWMNSDFARLLNESGATADESNITPLMLVELLKFVASNQISSKTAKEVFDRMFETGESAGLIIESSNLSQVSDSSLLEPIVREVLEQNPDVVLKYKSGQSGVLGFLTGAVMKKSGGKANPKMVNELLIKELAK